MHVLWAPESCVAWQASHAFRLSLSSFPSEFDMVHLSLSHNCIALLMDVGQAVPDATGRWKMGCIPGPWECMCDAALHTAHSHFRTSAAAFALPPQLGSARI
jgi:hypothetical protein